MVPLTYVQRTTTNLLGQYFFIIIIIPFAELLSVKPPPPPGDESDKEKEEEMKKSALSAAALGLPITHELILSCHTKVVRPLPSIFSSSVFHLSTLIQPVTALSLDPAGARLISGGYDYQVCIASLSFFIDSLRCALRSSGCCLRLRTRVRCGSGTLPAWTVRAVPSEASSRTRATRYSLSLLCSVCCPS